MDYMSKVVDFYLLLKTWQIKMIKAWVKVLQKSKQ